MPDTELQPENCNKRAPALVTGDLTVWAIQEQLKEKHW